MNNASRKLISFSLTLSLIMMGVGCITYLFWNRILVIQTTAHQALAEKKLSKVSIVKKTINLYCWHDNQWQSEETDIIWPTTPQAQLTYIIQAWLSLIQEEYQLSKHTSLQSVVVSIADEALISFDQNPFDKNMSTFAKWMWVEALLKTIRENNNAIKTVRLLVHHQLLNDYHLDFINGWPLEGFYQK